MASSQFSVEERTLFRQFHQLTDDLERAKIVDQLGPRISTLADPADFIALMNETKDVQDLVLNARINALRAVAAAVSGNSPDKFVQIAEESASTIPLDDRAVVCHRISFAYWKMGELNQSERFALECLRFAELDGNRVRVAYASSLLGPLEHLKGNYDASLRYAEIAAIEAQASGNRHMYLWGLNSQYNLAVSLAKFELARVIQRSFVGIASDRDMVEMSYNRGVNDALLMMLDGNLPVAMERCQLLTKTDVLPNRLLAMAYYALALAGLREDARAKKIARQTLSLASIAERSGHNGPADNARVLRARNAAIVAAYISFMAGDRSHGQRALAARQKYGGSLGHLAQTLLKATHLEEMRVPEGDLGAARGELEIIAAVQMYRKRKLSERQTVSGKTLTEKELDILRAASSGKTNYEIAKERSVSEGAVEKMLSRAFRKLDIGSRQEIEAKLRDLATSLQPPPALAPSRARQNVAPSGARVRRRRGEGGRRSRSAVEG